MTIPINYTSQAVRTVQQWQAYKRVYRLNSWRGAMRHYARQHGKAICFQSDDSALIMETSASNKSGFSINRIPENRISWHSDGAAWNNGWNAFGKGQHCPDSFPRDYRKGYHAARAYYLESAVSMEQF